MKRKPINKDGYCINCCAVATDCHETHRGRNRQLCIKYGMMVHICRTCHDIVTRNPKCWLDESFREIGKRYFEENYPELDFIEIFK